MVFYRKYRSQTINELDNEKLRETLYAVFTKPEIPHAFLFTGPKGLGKTSTARIIAKVINCEKRFKIKDLRRKKENKSLTPEVLHLTSDTIEPCNICETCISITKGNNIDVLEIDGASNRGIDEIRDLREKVRLAPGNIKKKIYIIDEVHMLTSEAFNALLKTIEEPPEHVVFIFCTTEPQKVPATIVSRCFHIALSLATEAELVRSFKRIIAGEKLMIDDNALHAIAKLANGGFRDGTKILEEIAILSKDQKITKGLVEEIYKVSGTNSLVTEFLDALEKKDTKAGLEVIAKSIEQGVDTKYFISQLLITLHRLLLQKMGMYQESEKLKLESEKLGINEIQVLVSLLTKAYQDIKYAVLSQLPLEMVVIAWSFGHTSQEKIDSPIKTTEVIQYTPNTSGKPSVITLLKRQQAMKIQNILGKGEKKTVIKPVATIKQNSFSDHNDPEKSLLDNMIYSVKAYNHSIAAVLRGCIIRSMNDGSIIFETAYKFHKERLDDGKSKEILEKVIKEITGKQLGVQIVLKASTAMKATE